MQGHVFDMGRRARADGLAARAHLRRRLGPLRTQKVSQLSLSRYTQHSAFFLLWCMNLGVGNIASEAELDLLLQDYVEALWDANAGLQAAQCTLAGIQHFLRQTVRLRGSWRLLGVWRRAEPPVRAPPMPEEYLLALAMQALLAGDPFFAASLLVGFYAYLRTSEILALRVEHFHFDRTGNVVIALGQSKSGKRRGEQEFAIIDAGPPAALVRSFVQGRPQGTRVVYEEEGPWRRRFDAALTGLGLHTNGFRPYSLRRGGATAAFRNGLSLSLVCVRGRWTQERTARIYLQEANALLQGMRLPPQTAAQVWQLASAWNFEFLR